MMPKRKPNTNPACEGEPCAECRLGSPTYIPCGKPATRVVIGSDNVALAMCDGCADHNFKNRGARFAAADEKVELVRADQIKASLGQGAMPVADVESDDSGATDQQLKTVTTGISRALKLQELLIPELQDQLAKLQEELKALTEVGIPNALTDAKLAAFTYADRNDGKWEVELADDIKLSVVKANLPKFIKYLVETKQDDLVKRKITIKFGRDQVSLAKKFLADLAKRKIDLHPTVDEEVNWQTLNSWGREKRQQAIDANLNPDQALPPTVDVFKFRRVIMRPAKVKKGVIDF